MPSTKSPRKGSMQFWPRVRAKKEVARVRSWPKMDEAKLLGFAGYKVGMTHVLAVDNKKTSPYKGSNVTVPATIIECPPIRIIGVRFYKKTENKLNVADQIFFKPKDDVKKHIKVPKKSKNLDDFKDKLDEFTDFTVLVHTLPSKTGLSKKKPEVFEVAVGGKLADKFEYVKENVDKDIFVNDIFSEGFLTDIRAVTTGKGFQGAVKRFGISTRGRKTEKDKRTPGSLGGWVAQQHFMYRVPHAGKMGYHTRTEYNKQILKISDNPEEVNQKGGFINYGVVKNPFVMIKGSLTGPKKRLIRFNFAMRPRGKNPADIPTIKKIKLDSSQGN